MIEIVLILRVTIIHYRVIIVIVIRGWHQRELIMMLNSSSSATTRSRTSDISRRLFVIAQTRPLTTRALATRERGSLLAIVNDNVSGLIELIRALRARHSFWAALYFHSMLVDLEEGFAKRLRKPRLVELAVLKRVVCVAVWCSRLFLLLLLLWPYRLGD